MSKKLGLALMFIGAYVVLLGGLFYLMSFYGAQHEVKPKDYEWVWGVICALIMCGGAVLACKKYTLGIVGFVIYFLGILACLWFMIYSSQTYSFLPPLVLAGSIAGLIGSIIGLIVHIQNTKRTQKYGESLL